MPAPGRGSAGWGGGARWWAALMLLARRHRVCASMFKLPCCLASPSAALSHPHVPSRMHLHVRPTPPSPSGLAFFCLSDPRAIKLTDVKAGRKLDALADKHADSWQVGEVVAAGRGEAGRGQVWQGRFKAACRLGGACCLPSEGSCRAVGASPRRPLCSAAAPACRPYGDSCLLPSCRPALLQVHPLHVSDELMLRAVQGGMQPAAAVPACRCATPRPHSLLRPLRPARPPRSKATWRQLREDRQMALKALTKAIQAGGPCGLHYTRARVLSALQKKELAAADYARFLEMAPPDHRRCGLCRCMQGAGWARMCCCWQGLRPARYSMCAPAACCLRLPQAASAGRFATAPSCSAACPPVQYPGHPLCACTRHTHGRWTDRGTLFAATSCWACVGTCGRQRCMHLVADCCAAAAACHPELLPDAHPPPPAPQKIDLAAARQHYAAGQRAEASVAPWVSLLLAWGTPNWLLNGACCGASPQRACDQLQLCWLLNTDCPACVPAAPTCAPC